MPLALIESSTTIHGADHHPQTHGSTTSTGAIALHYWCYILHGLLLVLQIILFAMLWSHPEHKVTVAFDNSALTIGLSAFLQAFYTVRDMWSAKHTSYHVFSSIRRYWSS